MKWMKMGGRSVAAALCSERPLLLHQLTHSTILEALLSRKILTPEDHDYIANIPDDEKKCEFFLEIVAKQNRTGLHIICEELRKQCPKLARLLHQPEQNRTAGIIGFIKNKKGSCWFCFCMYSLLCRVDEKKLSLKHLCDQWPLVERIHTIICRYER